MKIVFRPMDETAASAIVQWKYEPPYEVYNFSLEDREDFIRYLVEPENALYGMFAEDGDLIGFCGFGKDGQVPGGDYTSEALDIGMGIRPDLTGQGKGSEYVEAVLDFGRRAFQSAKLRVTIAEFNLRARRVWEKAGFQTMETFYREGKEQQFVILVREA